MNISEATKITVLHHTVKFKSGDHTVATLWLENETDSDVYISISNNELRDNFIKSGIGYDRWKDEISKELRTKVTIDRFKMLNDFYSSLSSIRDNISSNIKDGVAFDGDELKAFMTTDYGKLLQQLMDKNYPDGMTDEERLEKHQEILRLYMLPNHWEVTRGTLGDVLKHRNDWTVIADEIDRDYYKLGVRIPDQDYDKVFEAMSEHEFIEVMTPVFAHVLMVGAQDIQFGGITRVREPDVSEGEEVPLRFPRIPYLATNTLGNYNVDNVQLKRVADEVELRTLDLSERDCMGVLLDFSDPKTALAMLAIASDQDTYIYYLQPNDGEMEILPIENKCSRRSRRSRR